MASAPSTPQHNRKMSSSLNSSYENVSTSEVSDSHINIVTSDFYGSSSNYLSPLERKHLKRHLPSSGSDENANPTTSSSQKTLLTAKATRKRNSSAKNQTGKTKVLKSRSTNSNRIKKRKPSKGSEATALKNEVPKEEEREESLEKYKNNKFFKHGPAGYLRASISRASLGPVDKKPYTARRKSQSKTASKSLQPIKTKTVSFSNVYDSFSEDDDKKSAAADRSYTKSYRSIPPVKNGVVNGLDNTHDSLPNIPIDEDLDLDTEESRSETVQLSKSKTPIIHKFESSNTKEQPGGMKQRSTLCQLPGTKPSRTHGILPPHHKRPVTSTPQNAKKNISENKRKRKSAQVKSSAIADFQNLGTNNDQSQNSSALNSSEAPDIIILSRSRLSSSLLDSSIRFNAEDSSEMERSRKTRYSNRVIPQSDSVHDILKDLEETFNEIDPSDLSMQSSSREFHESIISPSEQEDTSTEKLFFPIFYPKAQRKSSFIQDWPEKQKPKIKHSIKVPAADESQQLIIDAGQKVIGATKCPTCGMVYHIGSEQDEELHARYHEMLNTKLKFPGWKRERVVREFYDGRIIMIKKEDPNFMIKKVEDVLQVVDRDLGFPSLGMPNRPNVTFLLFVSNNAVVGCLVAESITSARRVQHDNWANVTSCFPKDSDKKADRWCSSIELVKAVCGVNRIWVSLEHRRKKIATRLLDCLRRNFLYGYIIPNNEIAFSDPSVNGHAFGAAYMGTNYFLVYK